MPRLCPLFSGSAGNSYYIGSAESGILIDAGRSAKQITQALTDKGLDINNVKAIFITHEHTDHIKGLKTLASKNKIKVYASVGTIEELIEREYINGKVDISPITLEGIEDFGMRVKPFRLSHDCKEGFGYVVETSDGRKTGFLTDTGIITDEIKSAVKGCDTVLIESNHDEGMLRCGSYPYLLKRRILSDIGHLSNETCAETVNELVQTGTTRIILAHLSQKNNIPYLAQAATLSVLELNGMKQNVDFKLSIADSENTTKPILY